MKILISNIFNNFLSSLPYYLLASGFAFLVDIFIYVISWRYLGTNYSSILAFLFGIIVLYSILRFTREAKHKKKRLGFFIQLLIGLISLSINLLILNTLDWIYFDLIGGHNIEKFVIFYPLFSKFISSSIGFLASSNLTIKFNFNLRKRRKIQKNKV